MSASRVGQVLVLYIVGTLVGALGLVSSFIAASVDGVIQGGAFLIGGILMIGSAAVVQAIGREPS